MAACFKHSNLNSLSRLHHWNRVLYVHFVKNFIAFTWLYLIMWIYHIFYFNNTERTNCAPPDSLYPKSGRWVPRPSLWVTLQSIWVLIKCLAGYFAKSSTMSQLSYELRTGHGGLVIGPFITRSKPCSSNQGCTILWPKSLQAIIYYTYT